MNTYQKVAAAICIIGGVASCSAIISTSPDDIYSKVVDDAVVQYEIADRQGDPIQMYVQAGLVSAAMLQAKDEAGFRKWKDIEKECARNAGIPVL